MSEQTENTGQISVSELLARNGQQVESRGGRRRRGAAGGISVAELTGELPVLADGTLPARNRRAAPDPEEDVATPPVEPETAVATPAAQTPDAVAPEAVTPEATAPKAKAVIAPALPTVTGLEPATDRTQSIPALRRAVLAKADADRKAAADRAAKSGTQPSPSTPAAPTPTGKAAIADPESEAEKTAIVPDAGLRSRPVPPAPSATVPPPTAPAASVPPPAGPKVKPYTGTPAVREPALLAGSSLEADLLRQARTAGADSPVRTVRTESLDEARALVHTTGEFPRVVDTPRTADDPDVSASDPTDPDTDGADQPAENAATAGSEARSGGAIRQWAVLVGQAVVALVAGALLFKGFEKLWESLPWVALVLAVLVIAGLVAVVRVLRRTEDLLSLLIAVIVGVFVTIGPLVFVLSSS